MRSARCCANANSVNASNATKTNPEAMIRVMALPSAHGISCADPHPLFPGGAGEEKREENGEQDDPGRGSQRIIDDGMQRSEEHTSELQSLMRISYAVFCLKQKNHIN